VGEYGVKISQFGIIGAPRPPQAVQEQINAKVKAQQLALQKENEVQQAKADATKRVAQAEGEARARIAEAEGQAKANQVLMSSMTPALLEWRRLALQEQALGKWNGTLPTYNGGGAVPFISIEPTK
jgi:regulator of protease activity HflC (stomatin/prohibitin superfamily)